MFCVRWWSDAGGGQGQVLASTLPRALNTGQQKVQLYYKDDPLFPCSIIYLWMGPSKKKSHTYRTLLLTPQPRLETYN